MTTITAIPTTDSLIKASITSSDIVNLIFFVAVVFLFTCLLLYFKRGE